jgi:cyclopropane fatty-acyl-phospholipid synthase-like methyltransferase
VEPWRCDRLGAGGPGRAGTARPHGGHLGLATWIERYVFPGGQLFSVAAIERQVAESARLRITARRSLGPHYARTLRQMAEPIHRVLGPA